MNGHSIEYFLGVDAGGTSCRVRLEAINGTVLGIGHAGPATVRLGGEISATNIMTAVREALAETGLDDAILARTLACIGAASTEKPGSAQELVDHLTPYGFQNPQVVSDAHTACVGAHAGQDGGIVIIGTGAIGYGMKNGEVHRVGGHGFPAGDEGSGAFIGLRAVQLALDAADGLITRTNLSDEIYEALGGSRDAVTSWLAAATATEFATLAPMIVGADTDQSNIIMIEAGSKIEQLILGLNQKGSEKIALIGGLADIIQPYLSAKARSLIVEPVGSPVDGAIEMCRQSAGISRMTMPSSTPK